MWFQSKTVDPIVAFWQWFADHSDGLLAMDEPHEPTMDALHHQLKRIHPDLVFEFDVHSSPRVFIVSADGNSRLFSTVREIIKRAPQLPGWEFLAFRQPGSTDVVIEMRGIRLGPEDVSFVVVPDHGRAGVTLYLRGLAEDDREALSHAAFILLDNALGEFLVETAVGFIEFEPLENAPAEANNSLADLRSAVTALLPATRN